MQELLNQSFLRGRITFISVVVECKGLQVKQKAVRR